MNKTCQFSKVEKPLKFYEELDAFKLFIGDLGLLGALVDVDTNGLMQPNNVFAQ